MKTPARLTLLATSVLLVGLLPVPRTTPTLAARCAASKMVATGKAARVRLACVARATITGTDEDAGCHGRAEARLFSAIARAEAKGGCLTTADAPVAAAVVEACVVRLREALRPTAEASACAGGKLKTSGATILGKLRCQRTGALLGAPPSPTCLAKRDARLDAKFAKLDPGTSCLTAGDASPIRAIIDQCVLDVMGPVPATTTTSLVPVPSTTTTVAGSTTTSSTSTSSSSSSSSSSSTSSSSSSTSSSSSSTSTSSTSTSDTSTSTATSSTATTSTTSTTATSSTSSTSTSSTSTSSTSTSSTSTSTSSTSTSSTSTSTSSTSTSSTSTSSTSTSTTTSSTSTPSTSTSSTSTSTSSTTSTTDTPCGGTLCTGHCDGGKTCTGILFLCSCQ